MIKKVSELIKKYEMFIKYIFVAGISFAIDIVFFSIFLHLLIIYLIKIKYLKVMKRVVKQL